MAKLVTERDWTLDLVHPYPPDLIGSLYLYLIVMVTTAAEQGDLCAVADPHMQNSGRCVRVYLCTYLYAVSARWVIVNSASPFASRRACRFSVGIGRTCIAGIRTPDTRFCAVRIRSDRNVRVSGAPSGIAAPTG
jgi:hypothetical protein